MQKNTIVLNKWTVYSSYSTFRDFTDKTEWKKSGTKEYILDDYTL